jgi:hypothetical protein
MADFWRLGVFAAALAVSLSTAAFAAGLDIDKLAGVYKHTFQNANIDGDKYKSEDILEIVKLTPATAYVRTHLEYFNGHVCNIQGVASVEGDVLVYRGPDNVLGKKCVLSLKVVGKKLTFDDKDGACAIGTCGNRGMYSGAGFELKQRRAIRYLDLIRKSEPFNEAMKEYDARR